MKFTLQESEKPKLSGSMPMALKLGNSHYGLLVLNRGTGFFVVDPKDGVDYPQLKADTIINMIERLNSAFPYWEQIDGEIIFTGRDSK